MRAIKDVIITIMVLALVVGTFQFLNDLLYPNIQMPPDMESAYNKEIQRYKSMPYWNMTREPSGRFDGDGKWINQTLPVHRQSAGDAKTLIK